MATLVRSAVVPHRNASLLGRIWAAYELGRTRAKLRELPEFMLADIGVTRSEAAMEGGRHSWDIPAWYRG